MNRDLKKIFTSIFTGVIVLFCVSMYFYGGYKLFADYEYKAKHVVGGLVFPPYSIYVGIRELFEEEPNKNLILSDAKKMAKDFDKSVKRKLAY